MNRLLWTAIAIGALGAAACKTNAGTGVDAGGPDAQSGPVTALTSVPRGGVLPAGEDYFALPWPSNFYRTAGGIDLTNYPSAGAIIDEYIAAMPSRLDGWGLNAATFARFDGEIDPSTLPQSPDAARQAGASVYLVDVDPASPDRGTMWPLQFRFEHNKGETIGPNWLSAIPYPGFPLAQGRTYAMVVTTRVKGIDGTPVQAAADWLAVRDGTPTDPDLQKLQAADQPLLDWLDQPGGDERADVASAAVFTTQHATGVMSLLRQRVYQLPAPTIRNLAQSSVNTHYIAFTGDFDGPNFQSGNVPYTTVGGEIIIDTDGLPIVQRMEDLRTAMTIPATGVMPANGWPVVIYAHGTGGNYQDFEGDGTAQRLADQGLAVISMDQVLHGPRNPGGNPDIAFFNFANPLAARDNTLQGAADDFTLLRLAEGINASASGHQVKFDPTKIYFFGHSQGGLTGPPFISYEPKVKGAVLSGAGGLLYLSMLTKTKPVNVALLVATMIRDTPLDQFNPTLALLQTWIERADPANYGPLLVRSPVVDPDGNGTATIPPRPIYQSEGLVDSYAPPATIEGFATSIGGDLVSPVLQPVDGLTLRGSATDAAPLVNNLDGVTAVLCQYTAAPGSDGHFVVFDVPAAQQQSSQFLGTLATNGQATLVAVQ